MVDDNENNGVSVDVASPEYVHLHLLPSKLSLLLLHENDQTQSQRYISSIAEDSDYSGTIESESLRVYNPFYSADVNVRQFIEPCKFLPYETPNDKRENIAWATCIPGRRSEGCLIAGDFTSVLASYENVTDDEEASAPLFKTWEHDRDLLASPSSQQSPLQAIPPNLEILLKGVLFLRGTRPNVPFDLDAELQRLDPKIVTPSREPDKLRMALSKIYLEEVSNLKPPNAPIDELVTFIEDRDWISDRVWGCDKDEFLKKISRVQNDSTKRTVLRDYIYYNMAWVTKLMVLPVDSLHRTAAADSALRGIPPPGAHPALVNHVRNFGKNLTHNDYKLAEEFNGQTNVIEDLITLKCTVPTTINDKFIDSMKILSATAQDKGTHQMSHNMVHMLRLILPAVSKQLGEEFLMGSRDKRHGLVRILRGLPLHGRRESFRQILVSDNMCKSEEEADNVAGELQGNAKDFDDSYLCEVYIILWVKKFSKVFLETLKEYIISHPKIILIDEELNLKEVEHMTEEGFLRIFHSASESKDTKYTLDMYRESINKPTLLHNARGECNVGKSSRTWDPFNKHPFRIPQADGEPFPQYVVDLVWLSMLSNLSEGCNNAITTFITKTAKFPQRSPDQSGKTRGRRTVRCLLLVVSYVSKVTKQFFSKTVFVPSKSKTKQWIKAAKHCNLRSMTQELLALMSAVENTCPLFTYLGQNPAQPEWAKNPTDDFQKMLNKNGWIIGKQMLEDYICLLTVTFIMHVYRTTKEIQDVKDKATVAARMTEIVLSSLVMDCNKMASVETDFGDWTANGVDDLQVTPHPNEVPDFPHDVRYPLCTIVQAARRSRNFEATQRIAEFQDKLTYDLAWSIVEVEMTAAVAPSKPPPSGNPTQSAGEIAPTTANNECGTPPIPLKDKEQTPTIPTPPATSPETPRMRAEASITTKETSTTEKKGTITPKKGKKTTSKGNKRKRKTNPLLEAPKEWKTGVFPVCLDICQGQEEILEPMTDDELKSFFRERVNTEFLEEIAFKSLIITARKCIEKKEEDRREKAYMQSVYDDDISEEDDENDNEENSSKRHQTGNPFIIDEADQAGGKEDEEEERDLNNPDEYDFEDPMINDESSLSNADGQDGGKDERPSNESSSSSEEGSDDDSSSSGNTATSNGSTNNVDRSSSDESFCLNSKVSTINVAAVDKGNGERKDRGKKLLPSVAGADRGKKLPSSPVTSVNSKESTNHVAAIDKGNGEPLPFQENAHGIESPSDEIQNNIWELLNATSALKDDSTMENLGDNWADTYARL